GEYAFSDCTSLESITIPNSVTSIGEYAFSDCTSLTSITIPNSVTSIGEAAFFYCRSLKSITIPDSVTSIGVWAFAYCTSLTSITIPDSVTSIGEYAFSRCTSLESITIPNSVTSIGAYAFNHCTSLTSITIPNSVTSIGECAFFYCTSLKSITIPKSVKSIGDKAFGYSWDSSIYYYVNTPGFKIYCYKDTAGEKYAKDNGFDYELLDAPSQTHTHTYTGKITKPATCTATGIRTYTCVDGDDSYTEEIPKTAHTYTTTIVAPTYDAQGYTEHTCSVCGDSYKDNYTAKLTRTSIAKANVTGITAKTYTGKALKPSVTVKLSGKTLKSGTDYTVSYKNYVEVGTATVTVKGKGAYTGSISKTFKINPKASSVKKVTSPKTKQLKVTYKKVSGVTGYQVTYSTSSKFTKSATKTVSVKGVSSTSKTIKKLKKGKTYYVKVRSYKTVGGKKYYSAYSKVKSVKVK
ncbi:MAG: leucine-rich repeat domain-containing protein, partial [Ruminococcus sp.]|nr:leucine-rich repeat domain-containing protein [Ruminococcus sp.]